MAPETWVALGVLGRAHGLAGALLFHPYNQAGDALDVGSAVRLRFADGTTRGAVFSAIDPGSKGQVVRFEGVTTRSGSEALNHATVELQRKDFCCSPRVSRAEHHLVRPPRTGKVPRTHELPRPQNGSVGIRSQQTSSAYDIPQSAARFRHITGQVVETAGRRKGPDRSRDLVAGRRRCRSGSNRSVRACRDTRRARKGRLLPRDRFGRQRARRRPFRVRRTPILPRWAVVRRPTRRRPETCSSPRR